jgi:hypothetical protein
MNRPPIFRCLSAILSLSLNPAAFGQGKLEIPQEITVQAEGVAESPEGAKRALAIDAVYRVASTYIMQKQVVSGEDVDSKIAAFSDGVVRKMDILTGPKLGTDGLYHVSGKVVVVRRNLVDSLRKENLSVGGAVRSDDLFARAVSLEALQKNSGELLDMLFEEDPRRYSVKLVGDIETIPATRLTAEEVKSGGINWMTATVGVTANISAYRDDYAARLEKILVAISELSARYRSDFEKIEEPKGYVYPLFNSSADVPKAISNGFSDLRFGAVLDTWTQPPGSQHIYKLMFVPGNTTFARKVAAAPVFSSRVKWMVASKDRPFMGYNVIMVGLDPNGYPTLRGYGVAPAFFGPFEKLLDSYKKDDDKKGACVVVSLSLLKKDGSVIKKFDHPLPKGQWLTPAIYAGTPPNNDKNRRIVLMPIGLSPAFCDAMMVRQTRSMQGAIARSQSLLSSFSTISSAAVTLRFPLESSVLSKVSEVRVRIKADDSE